MKVYVITADADHECNTPIRCYQVKAGADTFMGRVRAHMAKRPEPPSLDDDAEFDRWMKAYERWQKRHPAGAEWATYGADFTIHPLRVL